MALPEKYEKNPHREIPTNKSNHKKETHRKHSIELNLNRFITNNIYLNFSFDKFLQE